MYNWGDLMQVMKKGLIVAVGVAMALPLTVAFAQSPDDVSYCQSLSGLVRTINRGNDPSGPGPQAMATCTTSPGASIPVLERLLTDAKVSLPPRPSMAAPPPAFNRGMYRNAAECLTAAYAAKAPLNLCTGK
jgi:hypothetical protein